MKKVIWGSMRARGGVFRRMGRWLLLTAVLCLCGGILVGRLAYAATAAPAPKKGRYKLRGPANKSDPHLAKMLSEEAAHQAGVLGILEEAGGVDAGAP